MESSNKGPGRIFWSFLCFICYGEIKGYPLNATKQVKNIACLISMRMPLFKSRVGAWWPVNQETNLRRHVKHEHMCSQWLIHYQFELTLNVYICNNYCNIPHYKYNYVYEWYGMSVNVILHRRQRKHHI